MELSLALQKKAAKYKVSVQHLVFADLLSIGYSEADAYTIAFPENAILSVQRNIAMRESILKSPRFKKLLEDKSIQHPTEDDTMLLDKAETAKMIMKSAMKQPLDSKERIDGLMKYSDLMGYKADGTELDMSKHIQFYLPLKCNQCPLLHDFNKARKEEGKTEVKYVEMGRVLKQMEKKEKEGGH